MNTAKFIATSALLVRAGACFYDENQIHALIAVVKEQKVQGVADEAKSVQSVMLDLVIDLRKSAMLKFSE